MIQDIERLASLKAKLKAREPHKEYAKSCEAIRKEIAEIEQRTKGTEYDL